MRLTRAVPALVCILLLAGCAATRGPWETTPDEFAALRAGLPEPCVPKVRRAVAPEIAAYLAEEQAATLEALADNQYRRGLYKSPLAITTFHRPWTGLERFEARAFDLAALARGGPARLPDLIRALSAFQGRSAGDVPELPPCTGRTLEEHAAYIEAVFAIAQRLHDDAVAELTPEERERLFAWTAQMAQQFVPQAALDEHTRPDCERNRDLCQWAASKRAWRDLTAAACVLARLVHPSYLAALKKALEAAPPIRETVRGVTGEVLYRKETPYGLILFGGRGPNTYKLDFPVAFLADLDGDDRYEGTVAASGDAAHPNSIVVDFGGNDTYECGPLGLATGRLGVGILVDLAGNDTYRLAPGSGGVGLGGLGILCDAEGNDTYTGTRFTQGAAIGGLGLLLDGAGNDTYTCHGLGLGFGGPVGVGAVVEVSGDDSYQCGQYYASGYNQEEHPAAKPGAPEFQYDAFGLGCGAGCRVIAAQRASKVLSLAGGVGIVLDLAGNDRYTSSNFSQGCGYFYGAGVMLDLAGDDVHTAARYGLGAAAHLAVGLCLDYAGRDRYASTGPVYTGGVAWDRSVSLFVDAGPEGDICDLGRTSGLGCAEINSWSVCADLGGDDCYRLVYGLGRASRNGLSVFYHAAGEADYSGVQQHGPIGPAKHRTYSEGEGGLFVDK